MQNRRFFRILAFSALVAVSFAVPAFADAASGAARIDARNDPAAARETLAFSRTLDAKAAADSLERGLPSSGALLPWYRAELARRYGEAGEWTKVLSLLAPVDYATIPDEVADATTYWHATALDATGQASRAADFAFRRIETGKVSDPAVYLAWFRSSSLGAERMIERFDRAFPVLKNTDPATFGLSRYLSGLCAVREGAWAFAELSFSRFTPAHEALFPDLAPWSRYYRAYSLYRLGRTDESIAAFTAYLDGWKGHPYAWNAATVAALEATQSADADALAFADRAISLAPTVADRAESTLLRASILFDRKRYREAETSIAGIADGSSTNGLTPSAARAQFTLAEISVRLGKNDEAESRWLSLAARFPKDALAEDAVFRAGELRYLEGSWARACELFERYRKTWPAGSRLDTVLRSGGDAYRKAGKIDLAILWWEDLVKKYPDASSVPRTLVDLVDAYREKGEYQSAIVAAERYRAKYPDEAKADGIDRVLSELASLKGGAAQATAALESDVGKFRRAETAEGRVASLALARRYLADYGSRAKGKALLAEIAAKAPKRASDAPVEERSVFASAWSLLGAANREDGDYASASRALLSAGTLWAPIDGERSAEALYGAVDCFLQAGMKADAAKTAETLSSSWPLSEWTRRAKILMER